MYIFTCIFRIYICKKYIYVYICIDIHSQLHLFIYICISISIELHRFVYTYINIYIFIHTHTHTHIYIYIYTCTYTYMYIHMYVHICIHICAYMYIYTYVYTYVYLSLSFFSKGYSPQIIWRCKSSGKLTFENIYLYVGDRLSEQSSNDSICHTLCVIHDDYKADFRKILDPDAPLLEPAPARAVRWG